VREIQQCRCLAQPIEQPLPLTNPRQPAAPSAPAPGLTSNSNRSAIYKGA